jgi:predicted nucleic acid-binding protein
VILLDTSGLLAALDASQRLHAEAAACLASARGPLCLSPFVLAELDYLLATRVGAGAQLALLDEVARGVYRLEPFAAVDVQKARELLARYSGLGIGLADASVLVLSHRHRAREVLTLDERHFRAIAADWLSPEPSLRLLPADGCGREAER